MGIEPGSRALPTELPHPPNKREKEIKKERERDKEIEKERERERERGGGRETEEWGGGGGKQRTCTKLYFTFSLVLELPTSYGLGK